MYRYSLAIWHPILTTCQHGLVLVILGRHYHDEKFILRALIPHNPRHGTITFWNTQCR